MTNRNTVTAAIKTLITNALSLVNVNNAQLMQSRFDFKAIALRQDKQSPYGMYPARNDWQHQKEDTND
ncbi:hypothetical protein IQ247_29005 [Plectonema cf. radiosum LEGE 06105]|uniref:Uncharacterized protein n=1 Tax=Plectonema cf. radiosum LEGE 06105 TaxID=945769 RepID=A0A8J7K508_9CYAN|nr:hypothetical protein [Plectonema radiosum]MBE9216652.1 hypothetical protein [Plectonema cf. radiosum LEGE 06105]